MSAKAPRKSKVGDTFSNPYISGNPKCHVRGFVDGLAVVRWWRRGKQRWEYEVVDLKLPGLPEFQIGYGEETA